MNFSVVCLASLNSLYQAFKFSLVSKFVLKKELYLTFTRLVSVLFVSEFLLLNAGVCCMPGITESFCVWSR